MSNVKKLSIGAVCVALCVVLPMAFHSIPNSGSIFSPMHIPALLCGLVCGPAVGFVCGLLGPLLSSLITGMPPTAYLPPMMIELAVYGLATGLLMRFVRTGRLYADLYISLIAAMLLGRVIAGLAKALIFARGAFTISLWASSYFVTGIPGIIIHLILVPAMVLALTKARLIPQRYPKAQKAA